MSNIHDGVLKGGAFTMFGSGARNPVKLRKGDKVTIEASHGIGHLVNSIYLRRVPSTKMDQYVAAQAALFEAQGLGQG